MKYLKLFEDKSELLENLCEIKYNFPEADFWLRRNGNHETVGTPMKDYVKDNYFCYLHQTGFFKRMCNGTIKLQHIRCMDLKKIAINFQ